MTPKIRISLLAVIMACGLVKGGTIDPDTSDDKHIKYGRDFHCVGQFFGLDKEGKLGVGSCVAIGDRVVLTAAHAVHNVVSSEVHINKKEIRVLRSETPTVFVYNAKQNADIAICFLKEPIGLDFYPKLYDKTDETGRLVSIAGYGKHGTFLTGGMKSDNYRRAGSNIIDRIVDDMLVVSPGGPVKTALEFCITPGDSGGGLFIGDELAGINCCVFHIKGQSDAVGRYGHDSAHTRISKYRKWILDTIAVYESGFHGNEFIAAKDINSER